MKTILISIMVCFSLNATASNLSPADMPLEQQQQLIEVLNQMDPAILESVLSEEALEWYIGEFTRDDDSVEMAELHSRMDFDNNPFKDSNAPRFN